jgi:hypothetical protein
MTGCIQSYTLSDNDIDMATEYMAGMLLHKDKFYTDRLLPQDIITGTEADDQQINNGSNVDESVDNNVPSSDDDESSDTSTEDVISEADGEDVEQASNSNLTEIIGNSNFTLEYVDYKFYDVYPEDNNKYFSLSPREGYNLMVISFALDNKVKEQQTLDLSSADINYQLDVNKGTIYKPLFTVLENDLRYINVTLEGGETKNLILVFEISKKNELSDANLVVTQGQKTEIIKMK